MDWLAGEEQRNVIYMAGDRTTPEYLQFWLREMGPLDWNTLCRVVPFSTQGVTIHVVQIATGDSEGLRELFHILTSLATDNAAGVSLLRNQYLRAFKDKEAALDWARAYKSTDQRTRLREQFAEAQRRLFVELPVGTPEYAITQALERIAPDPKILKPLEGKSHFRVYFTVDSECLTAANTVN
jgi:hypothetical protein